MPTSALALAGVIAIRPSEGTEVASRPEPAMSATVPRLLTLIERPPSRYRYRALAARIVALGVTAAVHVLIAAVVIYDWRRPETAAPPEDMITVTLVPLTPDQAARKPERGTIAREVPPKPAVDRLPPPIVDLPRQLPVIAAEPVIETPAPVDAGKDDQLAQATQAYRRAIMAQLAAERRYPRAALLDGYQGVGAILFHIDRDGRLLDVAIEASTGRKALDRAALALVRRAAPFPAVPTEMPDRLEVSLPIRFLIVEPSTTMAAR